MKLIAVTKPPEKLKFVSFPLPLEPELWQPPEWVEKQCLVEQRLLWLKYKRLYGN